MPYFPLLLLYSTLSTDSGGKRKGGMHKEKDYQQNKGTVYKEKIEDNAHFTIKFLFLILFDENQVTSAEENNIPDPDPYVFGPPGSASGSVSHKYGSGCISGSGSFPFLIKVLMDCVALSEIFSAALSLLNLLEVV